MNSQPTSSRFWILPAVVGLAVGSAALGLGFLAEEGAETATPESSPTRMDPARVMGTRACADCHKSETLAWRETRHANGIYDLNTRGGSIQYAKALNIALANVGHDARCACCHGTLALKNGEVRRISGVSCESCHGQSGGPQGWFNRHGSYGGPLLGAPRTREEETPEHRAERIAAVEKAGMLRSKDIYASAKRCFGCHLVNDEELVNAGHPVSDKSGFGFTSWTLGDVRHNFYMNQQDNADAPSLLVAETGIKAANRHRLMYVIGKFADLEVAMRRLTRATPGSTYTSNMVGHCESVLGDIEELQDFDLPEADEVVKVFGSVEDVLPDAKGKSAQIRAAADKLSKITQKFEMEHDGSKLGDLDEIIPKNGKGKVYEPPKSQASS